MNPKVTVLMAAYNAEKYISEAIESILAQTFTDFEFLIIDDGSTDQTLKIIRGYDDSRIGVISRANKGVVYSANEGVKAAKGSYIARMDADDISDPSRLQRSVDCLDADPRLGLIGSNYLILDEKGKRIDQTNVFTHPDDLKVAMVTCNQFGNGSTMMRKEAIVRAGGYHESRVEDYDLFSRISHHYKIRNLKAPLYSWRRTQTGYSYSDRDSQVDAALKVRDEAFEHLISHRSEYRIYSTFHPDDDKYREKKSFIFSNLAFLYARKGMRLRAIKAQAFAVLVTPRWERQRRHLKFLLKNDPETLSKWQYEGI